MKRMLTITAVLMLMACMATAGPTNKGSMMLGGTVGFTSAGGDLYKNANDDSQTELSFMPSFAYFVGDNIFVGADITFDKWSWGDDKTTTFMFGPMVGYYFGAAPVGDAKGTALPYLKAHFLISSVKYEDGFEIDGVDEEKVKGTTFGARLGMDYFMTNSVALDFGINFDSDSFKTEVGGFESESVSGTRFGFTAGIAAFIF